jgi:hypothetical protein
MAAARALTPNACTRTSDAADFVEVAPADHGSIETRRIWCNTALNAYIDFPHVGEVFLIEREPQEKNRRANP